jgi:hypothetical protein
MRWHLCESSILPASNWKNVRIFLKITWGEAVNARTLGTYSPPGCCTVFLMRVGPKSLEPRWRMKVVHLCPTLVSHGVCHRQLQDTAGRSVVVQHRQLLQWGCATSSDHMMFEHDALQNPINSSEFDHVKQISSHPTLWTMAIRTCKKGQRLLV